MSNYNKTGKYCKCNWCDEKLYRAGWQLKKSKTGIFYCGRECMARGKQSEKIKEIEMNLGIPDFKKWLTEKYCNDKLSAREIAKLVYGKSKNSPNILSWMDTFGIKSRERSEAVSLQWVDNDERKRATAENLVKHTGTGTSGRNKLIKKMQSKEYRQKCSVVKLGERNPMFGIYGENHPQWNPDLTNDERAIKRNSREYRIFRNEVYKRDNYTCLTCGDKKGGNLVAHHLNSHHWDKKSRTDVNNGATLCNDCHTEFHKMYGYKNNDLFQFSQFQEYKINQASNK